jgi:hypothetical protein
MKKLTKKPSDNTAEVMRQELKKRLRKEGLKLLKAILAPIEARFPEHNRTDNEWTDWANSFKTIFTAKDPKGTRRLVDIVVAPTGQHGTLVQPAYMRVTVNRYRTVEGIPKQAGFTLKQGRKVSNDDFVKKAAIKLGNLLEIEFAAEAAARAQVERLNENERLADTLVQDLLVPGAGTPAWWSAKKYDGDKGYRIEIDVRELTRNEARLFFRAAKLIMETKVSSDDLRVIIDRKVSAPHGLITGS